MAEKKSKKNRRPARGREVITNLFQPAWLLHPPVQRAAYSDRTAWVMAQMAALAYEKFETAAGMKQKISLSLKAGKFQLLEVFHNPETGIQAFLAVKRETKSEYGYRVLAFRGTRPDCLRDWMTDLRFFLQRIKTDNAAVSQGFHSAWNSVKDEVYKAVKKPRPGTDLPLYITGHSLGGALAVLAAYDLDELEPAACYTFGCPRVGNHEFNEDRKVPIYQIINTCDIVPRLPLRIMGYTHVGDIRFLNLNGRLSTGEPSSFLLFLLRTLAIWIYQRRSAWIGDHDLSRYLRKLEKYAETRNSAIRPEPELKRRR